MARLGSTSTPPTRIEQMSNTDEDDAARDRRVYIEEMSRLQDTIAGLQADNWRLIQKAERDKPPEIWWPLPAASYTGNENRTERQEKTDHERLRRRCAKRLVVANKCGEDRGLWSVRMEIGPDGRMTPMLRK
jgi:hypothetical protein